MPLVGMVISHFGEVELSALFGKALCNGDVEYPCCCFVHGHGTHSVCDKVPLYHRIKVNRMSGMTW